MPDQFSIRRQLDEEGEDLTERLKARREETLEAERLRVKRLVRLKVGVFFDPLTREVLRKVGSQYVFIRHDLRRSTRTGARSEAVTLKPIQGGLYWDPKELKVYQFRAGHYVLYSRDRRKATAKVPAGKDRRKR
jgi:hypothetical protein